jgi:hypothetical protein
MEIDDFSSKLHDRPVSGFVAQPARKKSTRPTLSNKRHSPVNIPNYKRDTE